MGRVTVYGAGWCGDTRRTLAQLAAGGVAHDYRDVDADPEAAAWVEQQNGGKRKLPTVQVGNQILSVPSNTDLDRALRAAGDHS